MFPASLVIACVDSGVVSVKMPVYNKGITKLRIECTETDAINKMSRRMGKPTICIGENKGADQLCSNCEADQRLCFRYTDSTFPPLLIPKLSRFWVSSVTVQAGLCRTSSEPKLLVFSRTGSKYNGLILWK